MIGRRVHAAGAGTPGGRETWQDQIQTPTRLHWQRQQWQGLQCGEPEENLPLPKSFQSTAAKYTPT